MTNAEAVRDAQPIISEVVGLLTFLYEHATENDNDRRPDALAALLRLATMVEDILTAVDNRPAAGGRA